MKHVFEWIELLSTQVGRGVYVWGGNGQLLDRMPNAEAWIAGRETSEANAARAIALYRMRTAAGLRDVRAFDCSGLMHWALKTLHILEQDVSARALYARCMPLAGARELIPGDFVFVHDGNRIVHVGAYVGQDRVIECKGRDVGVVRTKLLHGRWNRFARLKGAFVSEPRSPLVRIKGKSVRIRSGDSTAHRTIAIAHAGETYPLRGTAQSGWYCIEIDGKAGYITNRPRYTEVIGHAG